MIRIIKTFFIGGAVLLMPTLLSAQHIALSFTESVKKLEQTWHIRFQYSPSVVDTNTVVYFPLSGTTVEEQVEQLLVNQPVDFEYNNNVVSLFPTKTTYTISGYVKDLQSGEVLIGAYVWDAMLQKGISTNMYGFYSITLPKGKHQLISSYIGYEKLQTSILLTKDLRKDLFLNPDGEHIEEVEVIIKDEPKLLPGEQLGNYVISTNSIKNLPSLMGEPDGIKAVQAMPGVKNVGEGSSGMFVRGGGQDQNLILLDEAPVYNPSHILGFLSVFNPDALKHVKLFTGGIPASYGGRLSSLLDIRMKEGNSEKWNTAGGIGLLAARLTVEGPLKKNVSSILLSARRSYIDFPYRLISGNADLWFGDLNAKWNYKINDNNRVFASGYLGGDKFQINQSYAIQWGNNTGTVRWNHIYSSKLFSNISLIYSNYKYNISIPLSDEDLFDWNSGVRDYNLKADFDWYLHPSATLLFGANAIQHRFDLGEINSKPNTATSNEYAAYAHLEHKPSNRIKLEYGIRLPYYQSIASDTTYFLDANRDISDTSIFEKPSVAYDNIGLEPRIKCTIALNDNTGLKFSYSRNRQYLQMLSNSSSGFTSFDLWFPTNQNVPVQISDQIAAGLGYQIHKGLTLTVEAYYKHLLNQVDYADHAQLVNNPILESELRIGTGYAFGVETFLAGEVKDRLDVQISYTFARTFRHISGINKDKKYPALYDRPHDAKVNLTYTLNKQWRIGMNWVYASGRAATLPVGVYNFGTHTLPVYSDRNAERLPDYHRLDLSATLKRKKNEGKKVQGEWVFSILNVYNRHNTFALNFGRAVDQYGKVVDPKFEHVRENAVSRTYLFGVLPAVSYNFKF